MSTDRLPIDGPSPAQYLGSSWARTAKRLFHATRPKFYPASLLPVLAGTAWGAAAADSFDVVAFALAFFAVLLVHAGANVLNDVGDDLNGSDRQNDERIYPYTGGSRFIQQGIMTTVDMRRLAVALLSLAVAIGIVLVIVKGLTVLWFGLAGVLIAVAYSVGPVRLSSLGLGEAGVGIGFGVLPVTGSAWLQSGVMDANVLLFSIPISMWVTAILLINEVPDVTADAAAGKRTLPVRIGMRNTAWLYFTLHAVGLVAIVWLAVTGVLPYVAIVLPILLLVLAYKAAATIRDAAGDRERMTRAIENTLAIHTLGGVWLTGLALYLLIAGP